MKLNNICLYLLLFTPFALSAQIVHSVGATIQVNEGAIVHANGGVTLTRGTQLVNDGVMTTTKNSTLGQAGTFEFNDDSNVSGDGTYNIEQDWINDANFAGDASEVVLYGSTEQIITSNVGNDTEFNNLTLTGTGVDENARKTLRNVNASVGVSGELNLTDRELNTNSQTFTVVNPSSSAVFNDLTYENEGFVSSTDNGTFIRNMNESDDYIFPVGSSDGDRRYRPVVIGAYSNDAQSYSVRMNNYSPNENSMPVNQMAEDLDKVNNKYYHSIERIEGGASADLSIAYDPAKDQAWESIAFWSLDQDLWEDTKDNAKSNFGSYVAVSKANWDFPEENTEYALDKKAKEIIIVESFSPNGDGSNDYFSVDNLEMYPNTEVWIYTRWGLEVFHTDDYKNDWDGTSQSNLNIGGDELPEGTYYYVMKLGGDESLSNSGKTYKGFVYLKR